MCVEAMDGADRCRRGAAGCPGGSAGNDAPTAHQGAAQLHLKAYFYCRDISNVGIRDVETTAQFIATLETIMKRKAWNWNNKNGDQ